MCSLVGKRDGRRQKNYHKTWRSIMQMACACRFSECLQTEPGMASASSLLVGFLTQAEFLMWWRIIFFFLICQ